MSFRKVVVISKTLEPLFPKRLIKLEHIASFQGTWQTNTTEEFRYREDFQAEEAATSKKTERSIEFPMQKLDNNTLLLCVEENFLHVPPIVWNILSREIVAKCSTLQFLVIGTTDRIGEVKSIGAPGSCPFGQEDLPPLAPPEFITNFTASLIDQLIASHMKFSGFVAPSEGPSGFEKLSLETMDKLIDLCWPIVNHLSRDSYVTECHRCWRLNGTAMGAQTGLYL